MYTMKESVAVAKEADAKKGVSPTRSDNSIHRVRNEPERQLGSLRGVIGNIRRNGGKPSVESIATELSGMYIAQRAPVLLALQQTHSNRYVQRVVAGIQAKLKIGQPSDVYEQEADRVADEVMRMPEPEVQREAEEGEREEEEEELQAKELTGQTLEISPNLESRINATNSGGQPLPESDRAFFEPRFGYDFSQVQVHTDAKADALNRSLNARAFTTGQDIFFRNGAYTLGSSGVRELMAHELAHVVQQMGNGLQRKFTVGQPRAKYEQEAHRITQLANRIQMLPLQTKPEEKELELEHVSMPLHQAQTEKRSDINEHDASRISSGRSMRELNSISGAVSTLTLTKSLTIQPWIIVEGAEQPEVEERDVHSGIVPRTCVGGPSIHAPDNATLGRRLVTYGVLRHRGQSTDFANILYRHITAGTDIGNEYLEFLRNFAYPMDDFCLVYGGGSWNATFRDILRFYPMETPTNRAMRGVRSAVQEYDRRHLLMYDERDLYPVDGLRDPFARPLTPRTLRRKLRGTVLSGSAPEGVLLLLATDEYLTNLTLTAEMVSTAVPEPVARGGTAAEDVFAWGTAAEEHARGDPNSFDPLIVHWVNYYNSVFLPQDRHGNPNTLDPDLVKAMIWVESRFLETAASPRSSARGLMQVLGRERRLVGGMTAGISGVTDVGFHDPGLQIATGIRILFEKYRRTRNWRTAVRDYNGSSRREQYMNDVWRVYESHRRH